MGTRSVTYVLDEDGKPVVGMYRQMDGYPTGHGQDLKDFLSGFVIGNGIGCNMPKKYANGMGCLAAQMVAEFKDGPGGIYLVNHGDAGQDYDYHLYQVDGKVFVKIVRYDGVIYDGPVEAADMEKIECEEAQAADLALDGPVTVDEDLN